MADDVPEAIETAIPALAPPTAGALTPAPYSFEFAGEDRIRVTAWSSIGGITLAIHHRMHQPSGAPHASRNVFPITGDRLINTFEFAIGVGYLLNMVIAAEGHFQVVGQTFVKVEVIRGQGASATVLGLILQDYVTVKQALGWPGSPIRSVREGTGVIRTIEGTTPAAGVNLFEIVPIGARWELLELHALLTTSATVGNRVVQLNILSGPVAKAFSPSAVAQPASTSYFYGWMQSGDHVAAASGIAFVLPLPRSLDLYGAESLATVVTALAAGDQWSIPAYTVREWLEVLE